MSETTTGLDLDAIEARARHWDHLIRDDPETTLALVAEVRRLRAQVSHPADDPECVASPCQYHEVLAERDALQAALNFKRGIIADLSATIERIEDGVRF